MKAVIIIADGAADLPIPALGNRTPLEAARTPNLDALAHAGRLARAVTTPAGWLAGSDVCSMCLLGYDPVKYHTGRAPLEAAAIGLNMGPKDWVFRLNLVTVGEPGSPDEGLMLDHSAGALSDDEARELVDAIQQHWQVTIRNSHKDFLLRHGISYRSLLVDRTGRAYTGVSTTPPHEIPRQPWGPALPSGDAAEAKAAAKVLSALMESAADVLADHPVNQARQRAGKRPANMAWIWGGGTKPAMPSFSERFGVARGAMTTAVDLLAGIARLIGWERLNVPGVTSYHDNDYAAQGQATIDALRDFDMVCCHVEAPDEASHQGDHQTKVAAIEAIDAKVVGPIVHALRARPLAEPWRLLVLPDHYTLCSTRKHDATPVPLLMAGSDLPAPSRPAARFTEREAAEAGLTIERGHDLMEFFLRHGRR